MPLMLCVDAMKTIEFPKRIGFYAVYFGISLTNSILTIIANPTDMPDAAAATCLSDSY